METRSYAAVAALLMATCLLGACSGGGEDSGADPSSPEAGATREAPEGVSAQDRTAFDDGADTAGSPARAAPELQARALIHTGSVALRSKDVEAARFDVMEVVDAHRGEVADEQTATDDDGRVSRSRLVIRVPAGAFDAAMDELGDVPGTDLESAQRTSEDVTTQVIDVDVRVRAQERSLERVELLLARARSIRDIVWIETQLTRRQAQLDSLKSQQAYLADQTSFSTITLSLEQIPEESGRDEPGDAAGFLSGLRAGWDAMSTAATALATATGALLPFAALALLLGVPGWVLVRRRRTAEPAVVE